VSALELKKLSSETDYLYLKSKFVTAKGTVDLYIYFFEKGLNILKDGGILAYISPNRYLSASYGEALREFIFSCSTLTSIIDYSEVKVFENASTYPILTFIRKSKTENYDIHIGKPKNDRLISKLVASNKLRFLDGYIWGFLLNEKLSIAEKIIRHSVKLDTICKINATSTTAEADNYHSLINELKGYKLINTGTIDRYCTTWGYDLMTDKGQRYLTPYLPKNSRVISDNRHKLYSAEKIILAKIALRTEAFYDGEGLYASINTNCIHTFSRDISPKYALAWLNSKLFQYSFECFFDGLKMQGGYLLYSAPNLSAMFIKTVDQGKQSPFIALVDEILTIKKTDPRAAIQHIEQEIDQLFYKLFELEEFEINAVENECS
jgi:hypothetical protein